MCAQLADKPARTGILVEQLAAHAPVFDHLREVRLDTARQRFELREVRMFCARH
jgi:hypothetical protein